MARSTSSQVTVLATHLLPEARRLQRVSSRAHKDADQAVALAHLADTAFVSFLEEHTGLDLVANPHQFDIDKGYLIPVATAADTGKPAEKITAVEAPISLAERRKARQSKTTRS